MQPTWSNVNICLDNQDLHKTQEVFPPEEFLQVWYPSLQLHIFLGNYQTLSWLHQIMLKMKLKRNGYCLCNKSITQKSCLRSINVYFVFCDQTWKRFIPRLHRYLWNLICWITLNLQIIIAVLFCFIQIGNDNLKISLHLFFLHFVNVCQL